MVDALLDDREALAECISASSSLLPSSATESIPRPPWSAKPCFPLKIAGECVLLCSSSKLPSPVLLSVVARVGCEEASLLTHVLQLCLLEATRSPSLCVTNVLPRFPPCHSLGPLSFGRLSRRDPECVFSISRELLRGLRC